MSAAENPWGVPLLDVRPIALGMLSTTKDAQCARNAASFGREDGTCFISIEPPVARRVAAGLRYRVEGTPADGVLFNPDAMEQKWAIYLHRGQILFIRSWHRAVQAVADVRITGGELEVTTVRGAFLDEDEAPELTVRVLDFLIRSHAMELIYPAPLIPGIEQDPREAALWCFSAFGDRAHFATPHALPLDPPEPPLRTHSLLHIAVAHGEVEPVRALLDAGTPPDVLARDGLAPLHWALVHGDDTRIARLLLERGSPVDVRSHEGATPLMNAAQGRNAAMTAFLLDRGADPDAADGRGFTSLHRAAEMGETEIVRLLLDHGASPAPEALGHTPRSLAASRGHAAIVELLDRR
ncbi:ankyrin repeat domain-containing protein [Longimicrobium sp.]|uniref:ankyrin repeat domain-containing protein n=1 Tax=Longimicrobium sp. TaxID=2029185 RepID=UPI003B3A652A